MTSVIEVALQAALVLTVFIAGYKTGEVITREYADNKNMHK
jgi:hypothetical protein